METVPGAPLHFYAGDICDYFYHLQVPDGMEDWFSLPSINYRFLKQAGLDLPYVGDDSLVPLLTVLPMGCR